MKEFGPFDQRPRHVPEGRIPPNALHAEREVLGGVLLDNLALDVVTEILDSDDFYSEGNAQLFECMGAIRGRGQPVDLVTLREELVRHGRLEAVGGDEYLHELTRRIPSVDNCAAHAQIIRDLAVARRLIVAAHEIAVRGYGSEMGTIGEFIEFAERQIYRVSQQRRTAGAASEQVSVIAVQRYNEYQRQAELEQPPGIGTGITGLTFLLGGMHPGELIVIAGRPGMGKSALAQSIMRFVAQHHGPGLWFSAEMKKQLCVDRMFAAEGRVDGSRIRVAKLSPQDWPKLADACATFHELRIEIDDTPGISIPAMRARARRVIAAQGQLALIVVDYLQLVKSGMRTNSREEEVATVARGLKELAGEFNLPVIALAQLNRDPEKRNNKRPVLADLRESGEIEQATDAVAFIYRDEMVNGDSSADRGIAEIIVQKQRSGALGTVRTRFFPDYTRFDNLERWDDEPEPPPSKLEQRALEAQRKKQEHEAAE